MNTEKNKDILKSFEPSQHNILKALHKLQENSSNNYLDELTLEECARYFKLTKAQVYGIATYYSMFSTQKRGKHIIRICQSPVCTTNGADELFIHFREKYNLLPNQTTEDGLFTLETTECIGRCGRGPSMLVDDKPFLQLTPQKIDEIIENLRKSL